MKMRLIDYILVIAFLVCAIAAIVLWLISELR